MLNVRCQCNKCKDHIIVEFYTNDAVAYSGGEHGTKQTE